MGEKVEIIKNRHGGARPGAGQPKKKATEHALYIMKKAIKELYNKDTFSEEEIELKFIESQPIKYSQFNKEFVPWLSIIDVMMFNSEEEIKELLGKYKFL